MRYLIFFLALFVATTSWAQPTPKLPLFSKWTVTAVHDGDTFVAKDKDGNKKTFRPIGYDAPEIRSNIILGSQPYGRIAGDTLRKLIKGKVVLLDTTAIKGLREDKYGRTLCEAYFGDSSSVAFFMVSNGMAWAVDVSDRRIPKMNTIIRNAHRQARATSTGLWAGYVDKKGKHHKPESPWQWRKWFGVN